MNKHTCAHTISLGAKGLKPLLGTLPEHSFSGPGQWVMWGHWPGCLSARAVKNLYFVTLREEKDRLKGASLPSGHLKPQLRRSKGMLGHC